MTILHLESSTDVCSAALSIGGVPVASRISQQGANHAALLPTYIEELMTELRERHISADAVSLSEGPGSYTGLRIGTSTAKGICYGLSLPLLPVPTTEVLCAAFAATYGHALEPDAVLCPMIDARRMEVYTALYNTSFEALTPIEAKIIDADSFSDVLSEHPVYFFGNGAMKCAAVITSENAHFIDGIVPDARYMGVLAERENQSRIEGTEVAYFDPLYIKEFVAAVSHVKGLN